MTEAYISILTNDSYLPGALTLARALRDLGTTRTLAIIVSNVSESATELLSAVYDDIIEVNSVMSTSLERLSELGRPDLVSTYTKVFVWKQLQYSKVIYFDADVLPMANMDDYFATSLSVEEPIAASPDSGWPDIFNSGVFLTRPSELIFNELMQKIITEEDPSFDGGDQGLLNEYFLGKWKKLPFALNVTPSAGYQYVPAYTRFSKDVRNIHFIGRNKPWTSRDPCFMTMGTFGQGYELMASFHAQWWKVFNKHYFGKVAGDIFEISRSHPLVDNSASGEGHQLTVPNLRNRWDVPHMEVSVADEEGKEEESTVSVSEPAQIFPWESRRFKPERTFDPRTDFYV